MIATESGDSYCGRSVLLTPGATYRRLNVPGEDDLIGAGIHICATCDGPFYKGKELVVVGGGNSGVEEGLFLTKFATKVTILEVGDRLRASQILQEKAASHPQIEVRLDTTVVEFKGDGKLESLVIKDVNTEETEVMNPAAVFVFIGLLPNTGFVKDSVDLDQWGSITTTPTMETSLGGRLRRKRCPSRKHEAGRQRSWRRGHGSPDDSSVSRTHPGKPRVQRGLKTCSLPLAKGES